MINSSNYDYLGELNGKIIYKNKRTGNLKALTKEYENIKDQKIEKKKEKKFKEIEHDFIMITLHKFNQALELSHTCGHVFKELYHLSLKNSKDNIIHMSHKEISNAIGLSTRSLKRYIGQLKELGFIKTSIGIIYINPSMFKGSTSRRLTLMQQYVNLPIDNKHKRPKLYFLNQSDLNTHAIQIVNKYRRKYNLNKRSNWKDWRTKAIINSLSYAKKHYYRFDNMKSCIINYATHIKKAIVQSQE